jgi:hypothetical protein
VQFAQARGAKRVEALLRLRLDVHQAGLAQEPKVLRDLRLIELEPVADLVDVPRARAQQLDDAEAVRFPECGEHVDHAF